MKNCRVCGIKKSVSDFGKQSNKKDGLKSACRSCISIINKKWRSSNSEKISKVKAVWLKNNLDKHRESARRHRKKHPDRCNARVAVSRALKNGLLTRGVCEVCGSIKVQAHHHNGYDKENQLNVQWLCMKHHREADAAMNGKGA